MVEIKYNNVNPFGTRTPTVSESYTRQDVNGYIQGVRRFVLNGTRRRPSCSSTFVNFQADMEALRAAFALQFKTLEVIENGSQVFYHPSAKVVSINIPESPFTGFYTYEITLECIDGYNEGDILDPVNSWTRSTGEDGTVTLSHTVSARGFGENSYLKALNYVHGHVGLGNGNLILDNGDDFVLLDDESGAVLLDKENNSYAKIAKNTTCNRLTGEAKVVETWVYQPGNETYPGIMTYDVSISHEDGDDTVSIQGQIQVSRVDAYSNEIQNAKLIFQTVDFQAIAQTEYTAAGGTATLANVQTFSVNESPDAGTVSFSMSYNTAAKGSPYIEDTSTISKSNTGNSTCFTYTGRVKSDALCYVSRYEAVKTFFKNIDWNARILQKWAKYGTGEVLTANAKSKSITDSPATGEMSFSITYCADPEVECGAIENFKYSFSWTPSIQQYSADPILERRGYYSIQNLGYRNRQSFQIDGSARRVKCFSKEAAKGEVLSRVNLLMTRHFPAKGRVLISSQIEEDKTGDFLSFSFSWSGEAGDIAPPQYFMITDTGGYVFLSDGISRVTV